MSSIRNGRSRSKTHLITEPVNVWHLITDLAMIRDFTCSMGRPVIQATKNIARNLFKSTPKEVQSEITALDSRRVPTEMTSHTKMIVKQFLSSIVRKELISKLPERCSLVEGAWVNLNYMADRLYSEVIELVDKDPGIRKTGSRDDKDGSLWHCLCIAMKAVGCSLERDVVPNLTSEYAALMVSVQVGRISNVAVVAAGVAVRGCHGYTLM
jgi:hypothetical protein